MHHLISSSGNTELEPLSNVRKIAASGQNVCCTGRGRAVEKKAHCASRYRDLFIICIIYSSSWPFWYGLLFPNLHRTILLPYSFPPPIFCPLHMHLSAEVFSVCVPRLQLFLRMIGTIYMNHCQ